MGVTLNTHASSTWLGAGFVMGVGIVLFEFTRRQFARKWSAVQEYIEKETKRREAL